MHRYLAYTLALSLLGACTPTQENTVSDANLPTNTQDEVADSAAEEAPSLLGPQGPDVLLGEPATARKLSIAEGSDPDRDALLVAIDTPYQIFKKQGTYIHVAAWQIDGTPAKGASVFIGRTEVGRTDKTGTLVFLYPPKGSASKTVTGSNVVAVVDNEDSKRWGAVPFNPHLRTASFASDHLFVYTDRGVYRPGETVRMRILGWHLKEDYTPLREATFDVLLKDAKGTVVGGGKRTTDAFGVAHMNLDVPQTASEGLYRLEVSYKNERAQARLQVKDFKPPVVQIEHTLGRFLTRDQKNLGFEMTLTPSSGAKMGKADVSVRALVSGREKIALKRAVEGAGPHAFDISKKQLDALRKVLVEGQFLTIQMTVKDKTGSVDTLDRELRYTANPYVAVLETDKDQYTTDDPVEIVAKISDLDGVPQRKTAVSLKAGKKTFQATTDDSGTALFSLRMPGNTVTAKLFLKGVTKPIASAPLRWIQPRPMTSHIKDPVIKEREMARVVVTFPANIVPAEAVVHMDVVDTSGALVNAVLLPISEKGGGFEAVGEFDAPSWGSMLLTFFALGREKGATINPDAPHHSLGLLTEGQNLVVQPNKTLNIVLDGLPDKAGPGDTLQFKASVTSATGVPVQASVGAAVVDRRVLSLKDPMEITPMDHFYNPKLRTMSTTGSKILSWPVVSRNWGTGKIHDIALPPFPFFPGGKVAHRNMRQTLNPPPPPSETDGSTFWSDNGEEESAFEDEDGEPEPDPSAGPGVVAQEKVMVKSSKIMLAGGADEMQNSQGIGVVGKGGGAKAKRRGNVAAPPKPVQITIRTRFPETSLWEPTLLADKGQVSLSTKLPDAMAEQEIILVASDAQGGVGVLRQKIRVDQPVYVQADMPKALLVGETVWVPVMVQNRTSSNQTFTLSLGLEGQNASQSKTLTVAKNDAQTTTIAVTATKPGQFAYTLKAASAAVTDEKQGTLKVVPSGVPTLSLSRGLASATAPFSKSWSVDPSATGNEAYLQVTFPAITTAFIGADDLAARISDAPFSLASDLVSVALLLQYAQRHGISSPKLAELRYRLLNAISALQFAQNPDGSFSFWRNHTKSAFVTAWVLEGLLEAQQLDVAINQETIRKAAHWLASNLKPDGFIAISDISWWQGDTQNVRVGLTAEVFDILSRVPKNLQTPAVQKANTALSDVYTRYLEETPRPDPLAAGRALLALVRTQKLNADQSRAIIDNLLTRRDRDHWEPSWFHAYGGNIEATVAILAAMQQLSPDGFQAEKRDALNYILATRDAWGQWHNERGTAAAIRALLLVGGAQEEVPGVIAVKLDGKTIKTVKINPADPFLSAASLTHLDLGRNLAAGQHTVTVDYDGRLSPSVTLATRAWKTATSNQASAQGLQLEVSAPNTLAPGQSSALKATITRTNPNSAARLIVASTGLLQVDLGKLAAYIQSNPSVVTSYHMTERGVELVLNPSKTSRQTLSIPVEAQRPGQGLWPTVLLENRTSRVGASAGSLTVQP